MKYLRITYTKLMMVEVNDDFTDGAADMLVDAIAVDEVFQPGVEYDDVEWDMIPAEVED